MRINATDVLTVAAKMYVTHRLSLVDDHTLLSQTGGATWIPIPKGGQGNFAGLLTVDLPSTIRKGQAYTIVVRQMTNFTFSEQVRGDRRGGARSNVQARAMAPSVSERRVLGTFQLTIPVKTAKTLLVPEERLLAIMRWIEEGIPPSDKWSPVFERYVSQIAERVKGFGGDPTKILPSPTGSIPETATAPHEQAFTGKVTGLVYDRFGDFDGFVLITEHGHEEHFRGREHRLEELLRRAWSERIVITVIVYPHSPHWPASIILRY